MYSESNTIPLYNQSAINNDSLSSYLAEWVNGSAVNEAISNLNIEALTVEEMNERVKPRNPITTGGWWTRGVNWRTGELMGNRYGQGKPDQPHLIGENKLAKYMTASGLEPDAVFLAMPDKDYWLKVWADKKQVRYWTEGAKKSGAGLSLSLPTIALTGVWNWGKDGELAPEVSEWIEPGTQHCILFDSDYAAKEGCRAAVRKLAKLITARGAKVKIAVWPTEWKGMDDFIKANGGDAFKQVIATAQTIKQWEKQFQDYSGTAKKGKLPPANEIGAQIAEEYHEKLAYNNQNATWYRYEADAPGVWGAETEDYMESIVAGILKGKGIGGWGANSYVTNTLKAMRNQLVERKWEEKPANEFLPFGNGVLEIRTGKLLPHSPGYRFTWSLPRKHNPMATDWVNISKWLDTAIFENSNLKNVLIAFAAAVLKGRGDLQKVLHLIGIGGSGKGTFLRLLVDLIGSENVHTTTLEEWCNNRFESAQVYQKRLVLFPDEDKGTRSLGRFKSLTGSDWLRAEEKMKKPFKYQFDGMVAMGSNFPIFSGDNSSGIARRMITIPFSAIVAQSKRRDLNKEFQPELAAFTNYLLSLPDEWVERTLKGIGDVPEINLQFWENKIREDSIAGFLNDKLICDPTTQTPIGDKAEAEGTLYAAYVDYCKAQGHSPKANKNFSPDLIELCQTLLGWEIKKIHARTGKFIQGLRLRKPNLDDHIGTWDFELRSQCDDSSDGLVTSNVTGQNPCNISNVMGVTGKNLFEDIENNSVSQTENIKTQKDVEGYPSPVNQPLSDKGFNPSQTPITDPPPDPSPDDGEMTPEELNGVADMLKDLHLMGDLVPTTLIALAELTPQQKAYVWSQLDAEQQRTVERLSTKLIQADDKVRIKNDISPKSVYKVLDIAPITGEVKLQSLNNPHRKPITVSLTNLIRVK